jgi:hypothetical protein
MSRLTQLREGRKWTQKEKGGKGGMGERTESALELQGRRRRRDVQVAHSVRSTVAPRLDTVIREPTVRSSDRDGEDEVELLVEGSSLGVLGLGPGVDGDGRVDGGGVELTAGPERLVEVDLLGGTRRLRHPGPQALGVPVEAVSVEELVEIMTLDCGEEKRELVSKRKTDRKM